jgi:hypothetical protein
VAQPGGTPQPGTAPFEVVRFALRRASGSVALLELEGRFDASTPPPRHVRLVAETAGARPVELAPVSEQRATGGEPWRATFALPAELAARARFALDAGRRLLLELPAPDVDDAATPRPAAGGEGDAARARNELRRGLAEAREAVAAAHAETAAARRSEQAARAELDALRGRSSATEPVAAPEPEAPPVTPDPPEPAPLVGSDPWERSPTDTLELLGLAGPPGAEDADPTEPRPVRPPPQDDEADADRDEPEDASGPSARLLAVAVIALALLLLLVLLIGLRPL